MFAASADSGKLRPIRLAMQRGVGELTYQVAIALWNTDNGADNLDRQACGEIADEVAPALLDNAIEIFDASARMTGSSAAMRRGVKAWLTSLRRRVVPRRVHEEDDRQRLDHLRIHLEHVPLAELYAAGSASAW